MKLIENQKEDFLVLKTSIYELEAKPNRYISSDSLTEMLNEIEKVVSTKVIPDIELYRMYASLMAQFQSGHTGIIPTKHVYRQWFLNKSSIPIDVVVNGGKLYAYSEYFNVPSDKFTKLSKREQRKNIIEEDAEIVSIDGLNLESWMEKIAKFVGSDENQPEFRYEIVKGLFEFYRGLTLDSIPKVYHWLVALFSFKVFVFAFFVVTQDVIKINIVNIVMYFFIFFSLKF